MKTLILNTAVAICLFTPSTFAASAVATTVQCGEARIPDTVFAGYSNPNCLGGNRANSVFEVSKGSETTFILIQSKYDSDSRQNVYSIAKEISKQANKELQTSCGRGLLTARVTDDASTAFIFYTSATVVRWDIASNQVSVLNTNWDSEAAYTCGGNPTGPDAMKDSLIFDSYRKFMVINSYGKLIRLDF